MESVSRESKILIAILVVIVGGLIGLFMLTNSANEPKVDGDKTATVRPDTYKTGTGPVQVVEYGDFQCPACGAAYPVVKQIQKDYEGKITFYFRQYPLTQLHPNAMAAAEASESAGAQGNFWAMYDKLYESQKEWENLAANDAMTKFGDYAKALGLDGEKVKRAITSEQYKGRISQDIADGTTQGVKGTPTFFINGKAVDGFSYPILRDAIETALKEKGAATSTPSPTPSPSASPAQ